MLNGLSFQRNFLVGSNTWNIISILTPRIVYRDLKMKYNIISSINHPYKIMYMSLFLLRWNGGFPYDCVYKKSNSTAGFIVSEGTFHNRTFRLSKFWSLYNFLISSLTPVYLGVLTVFMSTFYDVHSTIPLVSWLNKEIELVTFILIYTFIANKSRMLLKLIKSVNALRVQFDPCKLSSAGSNLWHFLVNQGLSGCIIFTSAFYFLSFFDESSSNSPVPETLNFYISIAVKCSLMALYSSIVGLLATVYANAIIQIGSIYTEENQQIPSAYESKLQNSEVSEEKLSFALCEKCCANKASFKRICVLKRVYSEILATYKVRHLLQNYVGIPIVLILLHTIMSIIIGGFCTISYFHCGVSLQRLAVLMNMICLILMVCNFVDVPSVLKAEVRLTTLANLL